MIQAPRKCFTARFLFDACELRCLAQSAPRKPMRALPLERSLLALSDMPSRQPIPARPFSSIRRLRSEGRRGLCFQIAASFRQNQSVILVVKSLG